jgi:hypothetical protein
MENPVQLLNRVPITPDKKATSFPVTPVYKISRLSFPGFIQFETTVRGTHDQQDVNLLVDRCANRNVSPLSMRSWNNGWIRFVGKS